MLIRDKNRVDTPSACEDSSDGTNTIIDKRGIAAKTTWVPSSVSMYITAASKAGQANSYTVLRISFLILYFQVLDHTFLF